MGSLVDQMVVEIKGCRGGGWSLRLEDVARLGGPRAKVEFKSGWFGGLVRIGF